MQQFIQQKLYFCPTIIQKQENSRFIFQKLTKSKLLPFRYIIYNLQYQNMHKLFNKYGIESSISDYQPILTDLSVMNMHHNNSIQSNYTNPKSSKHFRNFSHQTKQNKMSKLQQIPQLPLTNTKKLKNRLKDQYLQKTKKSKCKKTTSSTLKNSLSRKMSNCIGYPYDLSDRSMTPDNFFYYEGIGKEYQRKQTYENQEEIQSSKNSIISIRKFDRELHGNSYHFTDQVLYDLHHNPQGEFSRRNYESKIKVQISSQEQQNIENIKRSISKSKKKKKTENLSSSKANSKTKVKDNAMKKIRNRLKVSPASYYEINDINKQTNHMNMRYDNEKRARRSVKKGILLNMGVQTSFRS